MSCSWRKSSIMQYDILFIFYFNYLQKKNGNLSYSKCVFLIMTSFLVCFFVFALK